MDLSRYTTRRPQTLRDVGVKEDEEQAGTRRHEGNQSCSTHVEGRVCATEKLRQRYIGQRKQGGAVGKLGLIGDERRLVISRRDARAPVARRR